MIDRKIDLSAEITLLTLYQDADFMSECYQ
ncbi:MAG: hypothetical protein ACJAT7_000521 [Psychromonas sp.]|jgi:hypothetical protein